MRRLSSPHKPLQSAQMQRGALLLEVLISILIFSFAILGLVALQARALAFSVEAEDRNSASLLASDLVASMWAQQSVDTVKLASQISTWQAKVQTMLPPYNNTVVANVTNGTESGMQTADITISWTPVGAQNTAHTYTTKVMLP